MMRVLWHKGSCAIGTPDRTREALTVAPVSLLPLAVRLDRILRGYLICSLTQGAERSRDAEVPTESGRPFTAALSWASPFGLVSRPILDLEILESGEVLHVRGNENQLVDVRYGSNLTVDVGIWTSDAFLSGALQAMPGGLLFAVREDRERLQNNVVKKGFQFGLALSVRMPIPTVYEFIPHDGRYCTVASALSHSSYYVSVRFGRNHCRKYARVEKVLQRQSSTFRPVSRARRPRKYFGPIPAVPSGNC